MTIQLKDQAEKWIAPKLERNKIGSCNFDDKEELMVRIKI